MVIENEYREKPAEQIWKIRSRIFRFAFFQSVELKIITTLKLQGEEIEIKADLFVCPSHCWEFLTTPWGHFFSYSFSIWYKIRYTADQKSYFQLISLTSYCCAGPKYCCKINEYKKTPVPNVQSLKGQSL